ncbi:MAG: aldo/keto reductase [Pseudomonadota bacterium]
MSQFPEMQYTELGRTGLRVSVAGLGCGGFSRLGQTRGASTADSVALVRAAMDLGVNLLDTAESYKTEEIVGKAVAGSARHEAVISSKSNIARGADLRTADDVVKSLHASLERLGTEYIDVYHLHGVRPAHVEYAIAEIVPALERERAAGRIRYLGITETAPNDPTHLTLERAVTSDLFDVVMVAFHLLHQNARQSVFPACKRHRVGTLLMFAVRLIFSQPERLKATLADLHAKGDLPEALATDTNPLGFVFEHDGPVADPHLALIDAAYRYARHEPSVNVVLFGTGSQSHLKTNIASILAPPLPDAVVSRVQADFGHLIGVGLDAPSHAGGRQGTTV